MLTLYQIICAAAMGLSLTLAAPLQERGLASISPSSPAFYSSMRQHLTVFAGAENPFIIPMPFRLGTFAYSQDGTALYASDNSPKAFSQGLYKIQLDPVRVTLVEGSMGLAPIAMAAAPEKIVISGRYQHDGLRRCGIFEIALRGGEVATVIDSPQCDYVSAWHSISLSPDGMKAVAVRRNRLELIDLASGSVRSVGDGYLKGAWSPDGRWIAALENGGQWRTILLDATTFERERILRTSEVVWSPDSRFLLAVEQHAVRCGSDFGTLGKVDIENNKRTAIAGSTCKINQATTGWVSVTKL